MNPFMISFGQEPNLMINRDFELKTIEDSFLSDIPNTNTYMITGVRGSGKTVALTNIYNRFLKQKDWIVLEINPTCNMLETLMAKLYDIPSLKKLFISAEINLSAFGLGVAIKNSSPINNIDNAIERMLVEIKKKNKKVLICVDEAVNNENMKIFTSSFQMYTRHKLPIFLVMTGLYQNIDALQNDESLTFLYRAPKIYLNKLSLAAISATYQSALNVDATVGAKLAKLTNGYAFAYQVLGYLCVENNTTDINKIMVSYDQYLEDYVYQKIWSELSDKEKQIVAAIIKGNTKIKDIRDCLDMKPGSFSVYRNRLSKKGIIDISTYGYVRFILPRFGEILKNYLD